MANSGGGADFLQTTRGLIFGPSDAYGLQLQSWGKAVMTFLDGLADKGHITATSVIGDVAAIVNNAILVGAVAPPPVFKTYKGRDALTTDVKQGDDQKIGGTLGVTISILNAALNYQHDTTTNADNAQNHTLDYEVECPLPEGDRAEAAARIWLLLRTTAPVANTGASAG